MADQFSTMSRGFRSMRILSLAAALMLCACGAGDEASRQSTGRDSADRPSTAEPAPPRETDPPHSPDVSKIEPDRTSGSQDPENNPDPNPDPETGAANGRPEPTANGDLAPYADSARRRYTGRLSPAAVSNPAVATRLLDLMLWGPYRVDELVGKEPRREGFPFRWSALEFRDLPASPGEDGMHRTCVDDASESLEIETLEPSAPTRVRQLWRYVDCRTGGRTALTIEFVAGRRAKAWIGFDRVVQVARATNREVTVSGVVHLPDPIGTFGRRTISTLLVEHPESGEQVLVDRFERALEHRLSGACCEDSEPLWADDKNRFSGKVVHSSLGAATVSTDGALRHGLRTLRNDDSHQLRPTVILDGEKETELGRRGAIVLSAGGNATATFETGLPTPIGSSSSVRLSLQDSTDAEIVQIAISARDFECGALSSWEDADRDELPDAWERCHGLDPTAPDADRDHDGDGLTNREELELLRSPRSRENTPAVDGQYLAVSVTNSFDFELALNRSTVSVVARVAESASLSAQNSYVLTLDGDAAWDTERLPHACLSRDASHKTLTCSIDYGDPRITSEFFAEPVSYLSPARGDVRLDITLVADALDSKLPDVDALATGSRAYSNDLRISVDDWAVGHVQEARALVASVDNRLRYSDPAVDVIASLTVPKGVVVSSASMSEAGWYGGDDSIECSVGDVVVCDLDPFANGELTVAIEYYVTEPGSHELQWEFGIRTAEAEHVLERRTTVVEQYAPMSILQALVDAAEALNDGSGYRVTLPPGAYAGTLRGRGSGMVLIGNPGREPTILVTPNRRSPALVMPIDDSRVEHVEFHGAGGPIFHNFNAGTIAYSRFVPLPHVSHALESLLNRKAGVLRLVGNRFEDWGAAAEDDCKSLLPLQHGDYLFLEGNTFVNNDCDSLIDIRTNSLWRRYESPVLAALQNNTFVGNPSLIDLHPLGGRYVLHLKNNIVVGSGSVFRAEPEPTEAAEGSSIVAASNLMWESGQSSIVPAEPSARVRVVVESDDQHADPLFTGVDEMRLSPLSPAIDAGVAPTTFDTLRRELGGKRWATIPGVTREIFDGSGDGVSIPDIGSHEYRLPDD